MPGEYEVELSISNAAGADNIIAGVVVSDGGQLPVKNTLLPQRGGYGMYLRDAAILVGFATNHFSSNAEAPMLLPADHVAKLDASRFFTSGNGRNGIEVMTSAISGNDEVTWPAFHDNTPNRAVGAITAQAGWKLRLGIPIEAAEDQYFNIGGLYLHAVGTASRKITFTGVTTTPGFWNGIVVYTRSSFNVLEHVQISYGGGEALLGVKTSLALTSGASLSITNSTINQSGRYGIHVFGEDTTLNTDVATRNTFTDNVLAPVFYGL